MKVNMECSACGKIHDVDLRTIEEIFTCDACGNRGGAIEETQIDTIEKQIRMGGKMGILSVGFTFLTFGTLWLWLEAFDHDPTPGTFQENAFYIFVGSAFLLAVFGLVGSARPPGNPAPFKRGGQLLGGQPVDRPGGDVDHGGDGG